MTDTKKTTEAKPAVKQDLSERMMEFIPFGSKDAIKLSIQIIKKFIAVPTKQGHNCTDADAMKFMMMCQTQRLNPFAGDAYLIGYDTQDGPKFSLITAHQAFLKRAEPSPEYDGMESGVIVKNSKGELVELQGDFHSDDETVVGGWARVFFKNRSKPMYKRLKLSRFNKGFGLWKTDPAGMIVKCTECDALRSSFPTMLGGLYTREEMDGQLGVQPDKVVAPMFKPRNSEPAAIAAEATVAQQSPQEVIAGLCDELQISVAEVEGFMKTVGMIGDKDTIASATEENLNAVIKNWAEIVQRINEGKQSQ